MRRNSCATETGGLQRGLKAAVFSLAFGLTTIIVVTGGPRALFETQADDLPVSSVEETPPLDWPADPGISSGNVTANDSVPDDAMAQAIRAVPAPYAATPSARRQLVIPRIGLNADVVEVGLSSGEWQVPRSVVAHLSETVHPGQIGNAVFAGHVIAGGRDNIFARLHELRPGDELAFRDRAGEQRFRVTAMRLVANTDTSVLGARTDASVVTLITCAGRWIARENDFDQRLIVVAEA